MENWIKCSTEKIFGPFQYFFADIQIGTETEVIDSRTSHDKWVRQSLAAIHLVIISYLLETRNAEI